MRNFCYWSEENWIDSWNPLQIDRWLHRLKYLSKLLSLIHGVAIDHVECWCRHLKSINDNSTFWLVRVVLKHLAFFGMSLYALLISSVSCEWDKLKWSYIWLNDDYFNAEWKGPERAIHECKTRITYKNVGALHEDRW